MSTKILAAAVVAAAILAPPCRLQTRKRTWLDATTGRLAPPARQGPAGLLRQVLDSEHAGWRDLDLLNTLAA